MISAHRLMMFGSLAIAVISLHAQPWITPDRAVMNLDELGLYSVGCTYRDQTEQLFPVGWTGFFEDRTGVACEPFATQNGKTAFLLHCPWRNRTGITFQQFAFRLPAQATNIILYGATAMRSVNVTNSDGVTYRLFANGAKLFDYHQTNDVWQPFAYNFTALRGSNLTLRFEVDPGPHNNSAFDYSLWGDRQLVLEGYAPPAVIHPPPPALALSNLWSGQTTNVAPQSGFAGTTSSGLSNNVACFRYHGPDGAMEYRWQLPQSDADGLFGTITLRAQMTNDTPVTVPLANSASPAWLRTATPTGCGWSSTNSEATLWRTFALSSTTATVRVRGQLLGKTLALTVNCDQPVVTAFDAGTWGPVVRRRQVAVPYYSGAVQYLPQENLFADALLDWTASAATFHNGTKATYNRLTDGTRGLLNERVLFTAAWHLAEVLPNPPNPPSPWRDFLADKIVLDIWGGKFANIERHLQSLADYGITNCVALIHDWQRSGYDNALPAHCPANPAYGGDSDMRRLVATGEQLGIRCALHENYVDYYPNYESYTTNDIALDETGQPQLAWYNPGTRIQSFAVKPNAILPLAATQSPEIHRRYQTRANYLDVHSAVPPWFHVDQRATETGAGQLSRVWDIHRQLWAYERATHGGPVFGEGNNHWYWSGLLDGVEAQFGSGWPGNGGFTASLAVEFDLLKIHPLQFNHGMGYYSRWWPTESFQTNWASGPPPMIVLDRYRMQEVAFGHAGFLDGSVYSILPLAWLEHHLLTPVMSRCATARPVEILYENRGNWLDATAVAKTDAEANHNHLRVRYENGLTVTANAASTAWEIGRFVLPEFGWLAEGPGLTAGTTMRAGVVTDFVNSDTNVFLNARAACDWNLSKLRRIRPSVASFQQTGPRTLRVTYNWDVQDTLPKNYTAFVHFCINGDIRAQQDHALTPPANRWQPGQVIADGPWNVTLPGNLPDGDYDWTMGLYDPSGDDGRIRLQGWDDGTSRIRLGVLHLSGAGTSLAFTAETNAPVHDPAAWYGEHINNPNTVVDFGFARTDGSVWLRREGNLWRLKTWPRTRNFILELNSQRFTPPDEVECVGGSASRVKPTPAGSYWRIPLHGSSEYRWIIPPPR